MDIGRVVVLVDGEGRESVVFWCVLTERERGGFEQFLLAACLTCGK